MIDTRPRLHNNAPMKCASAMLVAHGYIIIRGFASRDDCESMKAVARQQLDCRIPPFELEHAVGYPGAPLSPSSPGCGTIRRLGNAHRRHPMLFDWIRNNALLCILRDYFGSSVAVVLNHHNAIMTKQPFFSSCTNWHRDCRYWHYAQPDLVSAWLALSDEKHNNGGMAIIPESHIQEFSKDQFDDELFFRTDLPENRRLIANAVSPNLRQGDLLLFHCKVLHRAGKNEAQEPKFAIVYGVRRINNPPLKNSASAAVPECIEL